ncbi:MAG: hypothetical protein IT183_04820 [Acidobacteria bacterium]|nr:hypothetical protein [Acidobacteriota bacterium]
MVIKRINPMSIAKIAGVVYAVIGLLVGAMFSLFAIGGAMFMPAGSDGAGTFGAIFGVAAIVLAPIFYGVLGFVTTFIAALIFNAAAGVTGGVEIEVQ